ncbi:MAG: GNAT family N-acetyltransferase [Bacteroidetes bacterium]|nr:GNAT family N-acetyltransferase [Fibrella sp.]
MTSFTLQTNRLTLTPFAEADLPELHALFIDPDVRRYLMDDLIVEETWMADVVDKSTTMFHDLHYGMWAVRGTGQRPIIGFCGYWRFEQLTPPLQLIYGLLPACQGLATEAARTVMDYGFETVGFTEIIAATDEPNQASVRVMERLGMMHLKTDDTTLFYRL